MKIKLANFLEMTIINMLIHLIYTEGINTMHKSYTVIHDGEQSDKVIAKLTPK